METICYLAWNRGLVRWNVGIFAMVVKQSQRPRPPSPTLWAIVHKISDAHWQQLKAYSQKFGKQSMYFQLLEALRSMPEYNPEAEKKDFGKSSLHTMRNQARKWLLRTAIKLGLYLGQAEGDVVGVDILIQWECFDDALDLIENARVLATAQGDHARLTRLYEQEIAIARTVYEGEERIEEMSRLALLAIESARQCSIAAEVRNSAIYYIEINKARFNLTGDFDLKVAQSYFKSAFYKQNIDSWPITIQIDKLHIDEWNHYIQAKLKESIAVSNKILALYNAHPEIRSIRKGDHARILFRLSGNNSEIGNGQQGKVVLDSFRLVDPLSEENRPYYLTFFIQALFHVGYNLGDYSLAKEGATTWMSHKEFLLSVPIESASITSMLYVCSYHLAVGNVQTARMILNLLEKVEDAIQPLWARELYRLFHIIILIEEGDDIGLVSYARKYQRKYKQDDAPTLGLMMLRLLRKPKHIYEPKSLLKSLPRLLEMLEIHHKANETAYLPFTFPIVHWAKVKLSRLK
jgi:hypothetical protein